jgi:dihydrolipoamide dehydrogenase
MSKERKVDVAILGAGTAGLSAYSEVRKVTDNFVLIQGGPYGTTCARVGCMPSKVLIQAANDFHRRHVLGCEGILGAEALTIDPRKVLSHVRSLRDDFVQGVVASIEKIGDHNLRGYARFREPGVLDVEGETVVAKRVVIATGSSPIVPKPWQEFSDRILTTDSLFEQHDLPRSLALIGLGVIGVEAGQALARLGLEVTAFDQLDRVAGLTDPEVNAFMRESLSKEFPLHTGSAANLAVEGEAMVVSAAGRTAKVEKVLAALGRRPNVADLGLERLDLKLDERGLPPYDPTTLQVADLPIFIAGDANASLPLLHEAADEGRIAGFNAVQKKPRCFKRRTRLSIVFSEPNVAVVGKSFAEVKNQEIAIGEARFERQGRARIMAENPGILRVYGNRSDGRLLGAELAAPAGEHLAHLLAWVIEKQTTVFEALQMPFYHPVVEEGLQTALRDLSGKTAKKRPRFELARCESAAVGDLN